MSLSRYKKLTHLVKISLHEVKYNHEIEKRFYSNEFVYSSASPHQSQLKLKISNEAKGTKNNQHVQKLQKKNYKLQENPMYEVELSNENESQNEIKPKNKLNYSNPSNHPDHANVLVNSDKPNNIKKNNIKSEKFCEENDYLLESKFDSNFEHFNINNDKNELLTKNQIQENENNNKIENEQFYIEKMNEVNEFIFESNTCNNSNNAISVKIENFGSDSKTLNAAVPRCKIIETSERSIKYDLSSDEFNINKYINELANNLPGPLDECKEDLSNFGPTFSPTFNFAAYADKSKLIQEYVKLGIKLYKVEENQDHMRALLTVDLEKELPMYIQFLHDCGVPAECLGDVITKNPMILKEDLGDMKTRIRYLRAHNFTPQNIARIVTENPSWLLWATKLIDERLGYFQNEFKLSGPEVRFLATRQPKLITYNYKHICENTFAVREQMGFDKKEIKILILDKPRLWMSARKKIVDSFDYVHNTMKLSHLIIVTQNDILMCRKGRIKSRHEFLMELKKAQYDRTKPGYISPKSIVLGSDVEFCRDVAKTAVETYNLFLKTL